MAVEQSPLVSVVMTITANELFDEAVAGVLAQTHGAVELLLCDEGSDQASAAAAMEWVATLPDRMRFVAPVSPADRGAGAARRAGVAAAQGELVAFLNADDVWDPGHLSQEVGLLTAHPEADFVGGQVQHPVRSPRGTVVPAPQLLTALLWRGDLRSPMRPTLVRREALQAVIAFEPELDEQSQDRALLVKLYLSYAGAISESVTAPPRISPAPAGSAGFDPGASQELFLRWLGDRPQLQSGGDEELEEIRRLIALALEPYRQSPPPGRERLGSLVRSVLPGPLQQVLRTVRWRARALGVARIGYLRRLVPLSRHFGSERGLPIDRYYVERFLAGNAELIGGRVLEVGDASYTRRFGAGRVRRSDVLNVVAGDPETTIVADLADGTGIESEVFDCVVMTQTLQLVYDLAAAVATLHRIVKPGGTVLATFPGISPVSTDRWAQTWYWALTPLAAARLFGEAFGPANVEVITHGNVLTSVAFLQGLATHELRPAELDRHDPQFPMLITVRARRLVD